MIATRQFRQFIQPESLDVVLSPSGMTYINGQRIPLRNLLARICGDAICAKQVRIFASSACRFDHVAELFRLCKEYGVSRVELVA